MTVLAHGTYCHRWQLHSAAAKVENIVSKTEVPKLLDTEAAAQALGVSTSWLNKGRLTGEGPPFMSIGGRRLYAVEDLNVWLAARRRSSTSQVASHAEAR